jgi:hypothetical protein
MSSELAGRAPPGSGAHRDPLVGAFEAVDRPESGEKKVKKHPWPEWVRCFPTVVH